MSEMVERVAEVIMTRIINGQAIGAVVYEDVARAAIEAMREPTAAMIDAPTNLQGFVDAYRTMIDAALTPPSAPRPSAETQSALQAHNPTRRP